MTKRLCDFSPSSKDSDRHPSPNVPFSKRSLSRKLLIFAILFEVIAVTAGLALALGSL